MAGKCLVVHMRELPARVFEEKLPACRVEDGKEVYKESRGKNGDASAVLGEKKMTIRTKELAFPHEEECQSQKDHGR